MNNSRRKTKGAALFAHCDTTGVHSSCFGTKTNEKKKTKNKNKTRNKLERNPLSSSPNRRGVSTCQHAVRIQQKGSKNKHHREG